MCPSSAPPAIDETAIRAEVPEAADRVLQVLGAMLEVGTIHGATAGPGRVVVVRYAQSHANECTVEQLLQMCGARVRKTAPGISAARF